MTARKPKHLHGKDGQPTKYKKEYDNMAYIACLEGGFTDRKLAKLFNVAVDTITNWKHAHPEFFAQIVKGKDLYDVRLIENSLKIRAVGYSYNETTKEPQVQTGENNLPLLDENGKIITKMVTTKVVRKRVHADTRAIQFHLKNRSPERWPDKHDVKVSGDLQIDLVDFCNDKKEDD